jgi:hypothetical protein
VGVLYANRAPVPAASSGLSCYTNVGALGDSDSRQAERSPELDRKAGASDVIAPRGVHDDDVWLQRECLDDVFENGTNC